MLKVDTRKKQVFFEQPFYFLLRGEESIRP